jgi:hypothetical protein
LLLVSVVDGASDSAVLRALDGLAFARSQPEMLAHATPGLATPDAEVHVVLVAVDGFSVVQLERLKALDLDDMWLLTRRELRTQRGTNTRLQALDVGDTKLVPMAELPAWAMEDVFRSFLARSAPDRLDLALSTIERMRRLDPILSWRVQEDSLVCSLEDTDLCRLSWAQGHLELGLATDVAPLTIRDMAGIDFVLEKLLGVYVKTLSEGTKQVTALERGTGTHSIPTPEPSGLESITQRLAHAPWSAAADESDELEDLDLDEEDLAQLELRPMPPGPLLSREEIEAFQQ